MSCFLGFLSAAETVAHGMTKMFLVNSLHRGLRLFFCLKNNVEANTNSGTFWRNNHN